MNIVITDDRWETTASLVALLLIATPTVVLRFTHDESSSVAQCVYVNVSACALSVEMYKHAASVNACECVCVGVEGGPPPCEG